MQKIRKIKVAAGMDLWICTNSFKLYVIVPTDSEGYINEAEGIARACGGGGGGGLYSQLYLLSLYAFTLHLEVTGRVFHLNIHRSSI